jgi:hypothetical protein
VQFLDSVIAAIGFDDQPVQAGTLPDNGGEPGNVFFDGLATIAHNTGNQNVDVPDVSAIIELGIVDQLAGLMRFSCHGFQMLRLAGAPSSTHEFHLSLAESRRASPAGRQDTRAFAVGQFSP